MSAAGLGSTVIEPEWSAPAGVAAIVTTRAGGVSEPPYESFNLAFHVGDEAARVRRNRRRLLTAAGIGHVQWLDQEHGRGVMAASAATVSGGPVTADACWTATRGLGLAVLVADCVPLLLTNEDASLVAVVHCGWRGTVAGVVEASVDALPEKPNRLMGWLGPGVCGACYQVGAEVRDALTVGDRQAVLKRDGPTCSDPRWLMDLPSLIEVRLRRAGVRQIVPSSLCTICDPRFYSYRRDGRTGRFAALIWLRRDGRED